MRVLMLPLPRAPLVLRQAPLHRPCAVRLDNVRRTCALMLMSMSMPPQSPAKTPPTRKGCTSIRKSRVRRRRGGTFSVAPAGGAEEGQRGGGVRARRTWTSDSRRRRRQRQRRRLGPLRRRAWSRLASGAAGQSAALAGKRTWESPAATAAAAVTGTAAALSGTEAVRTERA